MSSLTYDLTLAGLAVGSAAALTGIGLIVTYRATGVLNLAHGAIAMVCAYVLRQFAVEWGWPLPLAAAVTLLVVAPGIGLVLDRLVFRPIAILEVDPARALVASIGVFVLLVGGAALVWGSGARAKLVVNLVLGLNRAALAEGLAFARRCGLDPAAVLNVLRSGGAYSRVMDTKGQRMLDGNFTPDARLAQHWKDVRLILAEARRAGATTPLSELHERLLAELVAQGNGELDNSSVIRAFEAKASRAP